jgi:two-component system NtrC family sensor kinase
MTGARLRAWVVPLAVFAGAATPLALLSGAGLGMLERLGRAGADARLVATSQRHLGLATLGLLVLLGLACWLWGRRRGLQVTEARLEGELRELRLRFAHLEAFGNDIVTLIDEDGTILEANDRAVEAYGYPRGELIGMAVAALRAPDSGPSPAERLAEIRRKGSLVFETAQLHRDGGRFPVEISTRAIELGGRTVFYSLARDISDRLRAEATLRATEERQRAVLRDLPVVVVVLDRDGRVTLNEGKSLDILGVGPGEAVGQSAFVLLAAVPGAEGVLRRALAGEPFVLVADVDGRWLECHFSPQRRPSGELTGAICVALDVTEQQQLENALRESEERLQLALAGTKAAAMDWDLRAGVLHLGPYWAALLELPDSQVRGTVPEILQRFVHADDRERVEREVAAHLAGEVETYEGEFRVRVPRGEERWAQVRGRVAVRFRSGRARRWVGIATDVTARREMQARLQTGERMASLGRLAGGMAHEINNPLAYVVSNLGFAVEELARPLTPEAQAEVLQALQDARAGAQRARDIVRDLRTFSQPGEDRTEPIDVRNALMSALALAATEVKNRARVVTRLDDVPPVMASERRLAQVFLNLVVNAAQALPGRGSGEIRVSTFRSPAGKVVAEVADDGCGMSPAVRARIFEPFFTTRPVGLGIGLGLSVCHGIVKGIGGDIEVETEEGKGSTFRVILPAAEGQPVAHPVLPPTQDPRLGPGASA